MRNSDKLSALGVKDDDLLMMVSVSGGGGGARYAFRFILQCTVEKMLRTSIFFPGAAPSCLCCPSKL